MRIVLVLMAFLMCVALADVDPPANCLLIYANNYTQLTNIQQAFIQLGWPHTDFVDNQWATFWTTLNDGTDWDFVCVDSTYNAVSGDFTQLTSYGTAHPDCRIVYFCWHAYDQTSIWSWFDITSVTDIFSSIPPAYVWDAESPIWDYAGLSGPPVGTPPALNRVAQRLGWTATKATDDVPLGWTASSTAGQGAWVFSNLQGTETWRRPHSAWLGFPMSMDPTNGIAYYKGILQYMWDEETNPRVEATSLGNVKALYR